MSSHLHLDASKYAITTLSFAKLWLGQGAAMVGLLLHGQGTR